MNIGTVRAQVEAQIGGAGYTVSRVRLRGHAPTSTCLWYEVVLSHPNKKRKVVYWNIQGGRAR